MKKINAMSIGSLSLLLPVLASADVLPYPGQNQPGPIMNQTGYQSGAAVDSGAGLLIIGIIVYFLFFKKSK
jgi:hypothetical protein